MLIILMHYEGIEMVNNIETFDKIIYYDTVK